MEDVSHSLQQRIKKLKLQDIEKDIKKLELKHIRHEKQYGPALYDCSKCTNNICDKCRCMLHNIIQQPSHGLCWLISIIHVLMFSDSFDDITQQTYANNSQYNIYINQNPIKITEDADYFRRNFSKRLRYDMTKPNLIEEYIIPEPISKNISKFDPATFCPLLKNPTTLTYEGGFSYKFITPFLIRLGIQYKDIKHIHLDFDNIRDTYNHFSTSKTLFSGKELRYMRLFADYLSYTMSGLRVQQIDHLGTTIGISENPKILIASVHSNSLQIASQYEPFNLGRYIVFLQKSTNNGKEFHHLIVYQLDSMILTSFAFSGHSDMHAICGVTCDGEEYIVNSHLPSILNIDSNYINNAIKQNTDTCTVFKYPWKSWKSNDVYGNSYNSSTSGCKDEKIYNLQNFMNIWSPNIGIPQNPNIPNDTVFYHRDLSQNVFIYTQSDLRIDATTSTNAIQNNVPNSIEVPEYIFDMYKDCILNSPSAFYIYVLPYFIYFTYRINRLLSLTNLKFVKENVVFKLDQNIRAKYIKYLDKNKYPFIVEEFLSDTGRHKSISNGYVKQSNINWKTYFIDIEDIFTDIKRTSNGTVKQRKFNISKFRNTLKTMNSILQMIMPEDFVISYVSNCHLDSLSTNYVHIYAVHVYIQDNHYVRDVRGQVFVQ